MNKFFEYIDRVSLMHRLITQHRTGTPDEFATRLGIKRTRMYEVIDEFKSRGAPILYSKELSTFHYEYPYDICIHCTMQPLSADELIEEDGGFFFLSSFLPDATPLCLYCNVTAC